MHSLLEDFRYSQELIEINKSATDIIIVYFCLPILRISSTVLPVQRVVAMILVESSSEGAFHLFSSTHGLVLLVSFHEFHEPHWLDAVSAVVVLLFLLNVLDKDVVSSSLVSLEEVGQQVLC
jgi:hypothetical protein